MKKKVFALIMAFMMAVPGTAFAVETDKAQETPAAEASGSEEPYDLSKAYPEYRDMTWDSEKQVYLWKTGDMTIELDPEDPEFYRSVFGIEEETIQPPEQTGFVPSGTARPASGAIHSPYTNGNYTYAAGLSGATVLDGVDVSEHQGSINWAQVKAAGIDFAIIRVGRRLTGSGEIGPDKFYTTNLTQAAAAGVKTGVYFFSHAISEAEAVQEAEYTLSLIKGYPVTLPVFIDFEFAGNKTGRLYNAHLSADQHQSICNAFCNTIKNAGYQPGIYADKDMLTSHMRPANCVAGTTYWLARWNSDPQYGGAYTFWQYSSQANVGGISTRSDVNFWFQKGISAKITPASKHLKITAGNEADLSLTATCTGANPSYTWSIISATNMNGKTVDSKKIATLSGSGSTVTLTGHKPGKVTISLTAKSGSDSCSASLVLPIKGVIDDASLSKTSYTYNGKARKPSAEVYYGGTKLTKDTHYKISYVSNATVGTATAVIKGTGCFCGSITKQFDILATSLTNDSIKIKRIKDLSFNPKGLTPSTTITLGNTTLSSVKDYRLSYMPVTGGSIRVTTGEGLSVITGPGVYSLVVHAQKDGVFTGARYTDMEFSVNPKKITSSMFFLSDSIIHEGEEEPTVSGAYSTASLVEGVDYIITPSGYSGTGTYSIEIEGIGNYTGTLEKKFKVVSAGKKLIGSKSCDISLSNTAYPYNGKAKKPAVTVDCNGKTLKKDRDYTVSYKRNKGTGTAYAIVTGIGSYSGKAFVPFTITEREASAAVMTLNKDSFVFNGKTRRPKVTVKIGKTKLKKGTDYRIIYSNPNSRNVGTYQVTVELRGNVNGTLTEEYSIDPVKISKLTIKVNTQEYTGEAVKPEFHDMVMKLGDVYLNSKDLQGLKIDGYSNNTKASSEARVTMSAAGEGNFTGSRTVTFTIKK